MNLAAKFVVGAVAAVVSVVLWNHFRVNAPVATRLAKDKGNSHINLKAYHRYGVLPSVLVLDLRSVDGGIAPVDAMRVILQSADALQDTAFDSVILAHEGTEKLQLKGDYFQNLGKEFGIQNPGYTMRTFPEHVYTMDGIRAYGTWTGGLLGVLNRQLADSISVMQDWYLDDVRRK